MPGPILCLPRSLPATRLAGAARRAVEINPSNSVESRRVERTPVGRRGGPRRLALIVGRKWDVADGVRLTVQFMDGPRRDLRAKILRHMNAWNRRANVKFVETNGVGQVRIARLDRPRSMAGYWSYVGTEILEIPPSKPTMNLEGFTMRTPDAEFRRVVRHEAGHTLGFDHEHLRRDLVKLLDPNKVYAYYDVHYGWTKKEVDEQVLTPLDGRSIMGTTESDPLSIMCYQIPAEITKNGQPILGGTDINPQDHRFAASMYPKRVRRR